MTYLVIDRETGNVISEFAERAAAATALAAAVKATPDDEEILRLVVVDDYGNALESWSYRDLRATA